MDTAVRERVWRRASGRCEYCRLRQEQAPFPHFHVEHIRPKKHSGTDAEPNLCLACNYCNLHKSSNLTGIDPLTDSIERLFNPRNDNWHEHFVFDGPRIVGLTPIGRATVGVLNMNDSDRLELRLELLESGRLG